jgi:hypothetical protein
MLADLWSVHKENNMSESQKIAELRSLLAQLDQPKQVAEAFPLLAPAAMAGARAVAPAVARSAASLAGKAKNAWNAMKGGGAEKFVSAADAAKTAAKTGAAAGAIGAGAGYLAGKPGSDATAQASGSPAKPAAGAAAKPAAKPAAAAALTTAEEGEMGVLAQEFDKMMGQDPALDALILQYQKLRPSAASAAP